MGIFCLSSSVHDEVAKYENPQPDQMRYEIEEVTLIKGWAIVQVRYPNCTSYEGRKVLVYREHVYRNVQMCRKMDPHFCEKASLSPFARFEPTPFGVSAAKTLCQTIRIG